MPRMFDMIRGEGNSSDDRNGKGGNSGHIKFPRQHLKITGKKEDERKGDASLSSERIEHTTKKQITVDDDKAKVFYNRALEVCSQMLQKVRENDGLIPFMDTIDLLIDDLYRTLISGDSLLSCIYEKREEYYLPYHMVNLLILASFLGLKIGFNQTRMKHLGLAAIFCDVGFEALREIIDRPQKLTKAEFNVIKTHISISLDIVEKIKGIHTAVKDTIKMHHERIDGSGYPSGLRANEINTYAKIIGLVDTYEAITHRRSYRDAKNAHKTIKLLLSSLKGAFDHEAMKILVNSMSIYPIGTIVELETGDIARVTGVKAGSPMRPVVTVIQDIDGKINKERKTIDLSERGTPSIINSI